MDFWKFLNLLETSCLYFCRADLLGDQFEGTIPNPVLKLMIEEDRKKETNKNQLWISMVNNQRDSILISSWTYSKNESFAMWKMYAKDKMGVAIKTDLNSLKAAFEKTNVDIFIGEVNYFNPDQFDYQLSNLFKPFLDKLQYYEFEKEIRCITACAEGEDKTSKLINVDLNKLIKSIVISPSSKPEFIRLMNLLKQEYRLTFEIELSEVNDSWL